MLGRHGTVLLLIALVTTPVLATPRAFDWQDALAHRTRGAEAAAGGGHGTKGLTLKRGGMAAIGTAAGLRRSAAHISQTLLVLGFVMFTVLVALALANGHIKRPNCDSLKILVAVMMNPSHATARRAIRETYGAPGQGIDVRFFIGQLRRDGQKGWTPAVADDVTKALQTEQAAHGDIVQADSFVDKYETLTFKTQYMVQYAHTHDYDVILKVDDDAYIRTPLLIDFIVSKCRLGTLDSLYAGKFNSHSAVVQEKGSKWYGADQYQHAYYPAFAVGGAYCLGRKAIAYVGTHRIGADESRDDLLELRNEDAAMGVWTSRLGLTHTTLPSSLYTYKLSKDAVFTAPVEPTEMYDLHVGKLSVLEVCKNEKTECLCWKHPKYTVFDHQRCWTDYVNDVYKDTTKR